MRILLVSPRTCKAKFLTTMVTEIMPGVSTTLHSHEPEQIYYILKGKGLMRVADEKEYVKEGDCIFIPPNLPHTLDNDGEEPLRYFCANAPSVDIKELEEGWPLESEESSCN